MIVYRTYLSHLPADRKQLIERSLVDEVARVVLTIPIEVWRQGIGRDAGSLQEGQQLIGVNEGGGGELPEFGNEILDRQLTWNYLGCHSSSPSSISPGLGRTSLLFHKHAIPVGIKPVSLLDRMPIRLQYLLFPA